MLQIKHFNKLIFSFRETTMHDWGVLFVRLAVGLLLVGAGISTLFYGNNYNPLTGSVEEAKRVIWIPQNGILGEGFYGIAAFILGILLLFGALNRYALVTVNAFIVLVALEHLVKSPFYNLSMHILPLFTLTLVALWTSQKSDSLSFDNLLSFRKPLAPTTVNSFGVLFLRLFIGSIFLFQGITSLYKMGLIGFAQKLYVTPFASTGMPESLLWFAGLTNPPIQILGGLSLILGFLTRYASIGVGLFLIQIIFGHMISDPLEYQGGLQKYGLANFFVLVGIVFLVVYGNHFSVDHMITARKQQEDDIA